MPIFNTRVTYANAPPLKLLLKYLKLMFQYSDKFYLRNKVMVVTVNKHIHTSEGIRIIPDITFN